MESALAGRVCEQGIESEPQPGRRKLAKEAVSAPVKTLGVTLTESPSRQPPRPTQSLCRSSWGHGTASRP